MLVLVFSSAFAWTLQATTISTDAALDVALGLDHVAWATGAEVVVSLRDGTEVRRVASTAPRIELVDVDVGVGDPATVLLLCSSLGLEEVDVLTGDRQTRAKAPCTAVRNPEGLYSVHSDGLYLWATRPTGLKGVEVRPVGIEDGDLVTSAGGHIAVAQRGGTTVWLSKWPDDPILVTVDDAITGLGGDDDFVYAGTPTSLGPLINGAFSPVFGQAGGELASTDVTGDAELDVIAITDGGVGVWADPWFTVHRTGDFTSVAAAPQAGACAAVVAGGIDGVVLHDATGCRADADEDGVTSEAGDCHDGDPAIGPDAPEQCNGLDDNCNHVVDDVGVVLSGPGEVDEGTTFDLDAVTSCEGGIIFDAAATVPDDPAVFCDVSPDEDDPATSRVSCTAGDQGTLTVQVQLAGDEVAEHAVMVRNVAPTLEGNVIAMTGGFPGQVRPIDFDEDVLVEVLSGPGWFDVAPDGTILNNAPSTRSWDARLRLDDQDGGVTELDVTVLGVDPPSPSCVSCSTAPAPWWLGGLLALGLARRRRYQSLPPGPR